MRRSFKTTKLCFEPLENRTLLTATLLGNVSPSGDVRDYVVHDDALYFPAGDAEHGVEVWRTTAGGVELFLDIVPGALSSDPSNLVWIEDTFFFTGRNPEGAHVQYMSDGTREGTWELAETTSRRWRQVVLQNCLVALLQDPESGRHSLAKLSAAGEVQLLADMGSPTHLISTESHVFFHGKEGGPNGSIWISDGTPMGTRRVVENIVGVVRQFIVDTGYVYTAFRFVIAVDGDGATVLASNAVGQILDSVEQATFDGKLYFLGENDATGIELWRTDGTQEGTELFVDLWEGSSSAQPGSFFPAGDRLYFAARSEEGVVQWVTDGTSEGTRKLDEPLPAIWSSMTVGDISTADTSDGVWMVEGDSPPRKLGEFAKRSQVVGIGSERIFVRQFEDGVEQIWGYDFASAGPGADFNGDNIVDQRDLIILAANFGRSNATRPDGDADDDGHVSFTDFLILASQFSG